MLEFFLVLLHTHQCLASACPVKDVDVDSYTFTTLNSSC